MAKGVEYWAPKTDEYGNTNRTYQHTTGPTASTGTSTGYTREGRRVDSEGNVGGRVDPTKVRPGGRGPMTPVYDPAAAASAAAASGAQARAAAAAAAGAGGGQAGDGAYGSQSGPGILESWFNMRAGGNDPAYEYAMRRGGDSIDTRMSAGGSFNSGARAQQLSDYAANMGAQRMGQLDALAGGASGEHTGRLNSMFNIMNMLAGGQSGLAGAYDTAAAGNMSAANEVMRQLAMNRAGVDTKGNQGAINLGMDIWGLSKAGQSG